MKNFAKIGLALTLIATFVLGLSSSSLAIGAPRKKPPEKVDFTESVKMDWPADGKWFLENTHTGNSTIMELYYPKGESSKLWLQMGTIEESIGRIETNVAGRARLIFLGTAQGSPEATWDIITMVIDEELKYKWVLFEIICPEFINGEGPQVQLWKIMGGKTGTFIVQYSYKGKEMPGLLKDQMIDALMEARLERHPITKSETDTETESK